MTRSYLTGAATLAFAIVLGACSGGSDPSTLAPTGPTPSPPSSGCTVGISGLASSVSAAGGRFPFTITSGSNCAWTTSTDAAWASVSPNAGQGNATAELSVADHTRADSRTVNLTIGSQSFRVVQNGTACLFTLDPASMEVSDEGGSVQITLSTGTGCQWTATAFESWIQVTTPSGTGNSVIGLSIARNTGDVRRGTLSVGGQQVTITQRRG